MFNHFRVFYNLTVFIEEQENVNFDMEKIDL